MTDPRPIHIRASSLSMFPDCCLRTASRLFRKEVEAAGFTLRRLPAGIGAATGTGCHAAASYTLKAKKDTGELGNATEAEHRALEALDKEIEPGVSWDDTSPNLNTAQKQTVRQVKAYRTHIAPTVEPILVEKYMEATPREGIIVTGHADCLEIKRVRDLKTGVRRRANGFQYGTYSMLARTNGFEIDELIEDYLPRSRITKPQKTPEAHHYNVANAEQAAHAIINRLADDLTTFRHGDGRHLLAGDPWAFLANPMSMLCSEKWCPAWGTDFCKSHT